MKTWAFLGERLVWKSTMGSHSLRLFTGYFKGKLLGWHSKVLLLARESCFRLTTPQILGEVHTVGYRKRPSLHSLWKPQGIVSRAITANVGWNTEGQSSLSICIKLQHLGGHWLKCLVLSESHLINKIRAKRATSKISQLTNMLGPPTCRARRGPLHTFCFSLCLLTCFSLCSGHPSPRPIAFYPFMCQQNYHGEASLSQMDVFSFFSPLFLSDV